MASFNMPAAAHIIAPVQTLNGGGVERVLLRLSGEWIARGRRVTLVVGSRVGPLAAELPAGVEIVDLHDSRYTALARAMPGIVRESGADVLFCAGNHYSSIAAWTWLRLGRRCPPIVAKVSNALVRRDQRGIEKLGYPWWLRQHRRFLDAVVAMTPRSRDEAIATMGIAPERVRVIPNPPPLPGKGARLAGRYLLGVGRLAPQKRWDRAIEALARVADREVTLTIFGEGLERPALEAHIAALGLGDRVRLPGYNGDPGAAIAGAAAVILTSDYEGVPGVLREALAAGTPVITTESSVAVREIVTSDDLGSVVAVNDTGALVAAIDRWLAPGQPRPRPIAAIGDPAGDYLSLFDSLTS